MALIVENLLSVSDCQLVLAQLEQTTFASGKRTAASRAAKRKTNEEALEEETRELEASVKKAILASRKLCNYAFPKHIAQVKFSRYEPGTEYGYHIDAPKMQSAEPMRADISMTLFLSSSDSYEGGELCIDTPYGEQQIKLEQGSAVLYPSNSRHRVAVVQSGIRIAAVTWIHSRIKNAEKREILHDLRTVMEVMNEKSTTGLEVELVNKTHANLVRYWWE